MQRLLRLRNCKKSLKVKVTQTTIPLPDLEPVSKVVKTGDDKEMFVLMSNTNNVFDDEKSRAASFEIIENNGEEFYKSKSINYWSLLGEKHAS